MICVTRLKGQLVAINPDLIERVEETPDTHVRFTNQESLVIRESLEEVVQLVGEYRRFLISAFAADPVRLVSRPPREMRAPRHSDEDE